LTSVSTNKSFVYPYLRRLPNQDCFPTELRDSGTNSINP